MLTRRALRRAGIALAIVVGSTAGVSGVAGAQQGPELLRDGGFETGDLSGFTVDTGTCGAGSGPTVMSEFPNEHGGTYSAVFGSSCSTSIFQIVTTTPGQVYTFAADYRRGSNSAGGSIQFGNFLVPIEGGFEGSAAGGYLAVSDTTRFTLGGANGFTVDAVRVTQNPSTPVTTTPEPSSLALLGTGLVGLVPMVRRRKR